MDKFTVTYSPVSEEDGGFSIGAEVGNKIDIEYALKNEALDIGTKLENGRMLYVVRRHKRTKKLILEKLNRR